MNYTELRIGNLVCRKDLISDEDRFEKIIFLSDKVTTSGPFRIVCFYSEIKPIPLSKKWLLKFGFYQWSKIEFSKEFKSWSLWVFTDVNKFEIVHNEDRNCFNPDIQIKYVHQLQNLYFALTGEELKIK